MITWHIGLLLLRPTAIYTHLLIAIPSESYLINTTRRQSLYFFYSIDQYINKYYLYWGAIDMYIYGSFFLSTPT